MAHYARLQLDRCLLCVAGFAALTPLFSATAAVPHSSAFNLPGQARTRTCVTMKGAKVPLRFADGTPTGWFVSGADPSQQGGTHAACPPGTMEMDVHEVLTTADGMKLYFHPGGGPGHYRDCVENGEYGHIALEDMISPPKPAGDINGNPAPVDSARYFVTPTRFPRDMWYKPNVSDGRSGSTYFTYGNPGYDKTGGRGDWTYINWSWVQNGGAKYPQNKCGGGGMVRALGRRDALLDACLVEPIVGFSYGADNQVNGRVTAFYGRTFAGPGQQGSEIYGWMPHSYQKNGDLIVPCVRRAHVESHPANAVCSSKDRLERMAWNLLHPITPDASIRRELVKTYTKEHDAMARMELLTEISRMDDTDTVATLLTLLSAERNPRVREQAIAVIGFMASATKQLNQLSVAMTENYRRADEREKMRALDVMSNFPAPDAVQFMTSIWRTSQNDIARLASADAILKLAPRVKVNETIARAASDLRAKVQTPRPDPE